MDNYIIINTKNLIDNVKKITEKYNNYEYYIAVIKANAYGHGLEISNYLENTKINYLAVSTLEEAIKLRSINKNFPILCLHPIKIEDIKTCIKHNITITITNYDFYKELTKQPINKKLKVHLKLNTGMNRLGIENINEINEIYNNLINSKNIELEGIYTHMATLGIIDKKWDEQINNFIKLTSQIDLNKIKIRHIFSSNSLYLHKKLPFLNGVRIGQMLYNSHFSPINETGLINKLKKIKRNMIRNKLKLSPLNNNYELDLKNTLTLCSTIIEIKKVKKGETIGYDATYKLEKDSYIATIPIGYSDGLSKNIKYISIKDKKYKIIGEINMCMITALVDKTIKINDEVIIFGNNCIKPQDINEPIPHLYSCLDKNIKRIYK